MKTAAIILAVVCVATVLSELVGLGFLWYRGQLTPATIADIRLALSGENDGSFGDGEDNKQDQPSSTDYARQRVTRIFELSRREEELNLLKGAVADTRKGLIDDQGSFLQKKKDFETQLRQLQTTTTSTAMEQTRGILLSLQPADAVDNLMALSADDNVLLLQGMPEKSIARILQAFLGGADNERQRGQEVFKAISQGDPSKGLIDDALNQLTGDAAAN